MVLTGTLIPDHVLPCFRLSKLDLKAFKCSQVTGGDPIELDGEINLCGRAENSTDRFFDGSMAHLSVFNTPLSADNVRNLYEVLLSSPMQVDGTKNADGAKQAHSGSPCLFPALFRYCNTVALISDCRFRY